MSHPIQAARGVPATARLRTLPGLLFLLLVAAPGAGRAQGIRESFELGGAARDLAIDEAVAIALEDNPDIRSSRFRFDATRAGLWEAYGNFLPQLNLTGALQKSGRGQFVIGGVTFPSPQTYTTYYEFDLTHRLFDAGRDFFRLDVAHAARRAADAQVDEDRLRTTAQVKRAYVAALAAAALRREADHEVLARTSRLDLAQARYDLGSVTRSDVLQARIAVSEAEVDRVNAQRDERRSKLDLLRAMGQVGEPDSLRLTEALAVFEPAMDPDSLVERALRDRPLLRRLRAIQQERESETWIAKTAYLPTLEAGASFSSSVSDTSGFLFRDLENRSVYSLSLNWELFGGFSRYNQTSQANAERRAAEEAVRASELDTDAAVRQAYASVLASYATNRSKEQSVELARQELELAQERYRIGALSFPDLLESQATFTTAQTDYIRSTYDFYAALVDLEEASGQRLFPNGSAATP